MLLKFLPEIIFWSGFFGLMISFFFLEAYPQIIMSIIFIVIIFVNKAKAETYYRFTYKSGLVVGSPGADYFDARSKASKICYQALTKGVYPGEEKGLEFIDECSNPVEKK